MSGSAPKKAAPKKAAKKATPKAAPPSSPTSEGTAAADGVERARLRRLVAAGCEADRCALLGIKLDVGPRANHWHRPRRLGGHVMSELGVAIVKSGVSREALEFAAAWVSQWREA